VVKTDFGNGACSVGRAASVLGDTWTLLIMRNAMLGKTRFDDFRVDLGIADNVLSNRLGRLVAAGLLVREPYLEGNRTRMHYRLTRAGADLRPVLETLAAWAYIHVEPGAAADPMATVHRPCGEVSADGLYCATCDVPVTNDDAAWSMPWRSAEPIPLATAVG
jgi:DNA-binding HxlR family transcriptional regulator